jgi:hypothetical protein
MKKIAMVVLLLSTLCVAGKNPADYPINVHVTGSRLEGVPGAPATSIWT